MGFMTLKHSGTITNVFPVESLPQVQNEALGNFHALNKKEEEVGFIAKELSIRLYLEKQEEGGILPLFPRCKGGEEIALPISVDDKGMKE